MPETEFDEKSIATITESRGVFLGATCFCASVAVLVVDGIGGRFYKYNNSNPFLICLGLKGSVILLTIVLYSTVFS